jgi:hypothetical protein|nr:MAG TPA_asm: YozD-like protein [Caudoviricetes sp.]
MATIYREVEVKIDTDEIWEEVLDELSTEEIEEYLEERRVRKKNSSRLHIRGCGECLA